MKKTIIIAVVVLSSAITAFAFTGKKADEKTVSNVKVETANIAGKSNSVSGAQLGSAD